MADNEANAAEAVEKTFQMFADEAHNKDQVDSERRKNLEALKKEQLKDIAELLEVSVDLPAAKPDLVNAIFGAKDKLPFCVPKDHADDFLKALKAHIQKPAAGAVAKRLKLPEKWEKYLSCAYERCIGMYLENATVCPECRKSVFCHEVLHAQRRRCGDCGKSVQQLNINLSNVGSTMDCNAFFGFNPAMVGASDHNTFSSSSSSAGNSIILHGETKFFTIGHCIKIMKEGRSFQLEKLAKNEQELQRFTSSAPDLVLAFWSEFHKIRAIAFNTHEIMMDCFFLALEGPRLLRVGYTYASVSTIFREAVRVFAPNSLWKCEAWYHIVGENGRWRVYEQMGGHSDNHRAGSGKRKVCDFWMRGFCREGDACNFAHPERRAQDRNFGSKRIRNVDHSPPRGPRA
jgi:hypothetical protein